MSKHAARFAPIFVCTMHAVLGMNMSGVMVRDDDQVNLLRGDARVFDRRHFAAFAARSLVNSPSAAMRRSRMPVREVIHSSEVSTIFSSSALVSTLSGRYLPVPMMETVRLGRCVRVRGWSGGVMVNLDGLDDVRVHLVADALARPCGVRS